ncbi:hypothetical protein ACFX2A_023886 [Malus domestica]
MGYDYDYDYDRWKICSKSIKHISIEPEGYDYDRGINWTVLVDSPNVSSFSFNAGSFNKFAVNNGSSPCELRKLWFKIRQVSSTHTAESIILCVGSKTLRANAPKSTCESSYFPSASVCKQASTNEQNSGENLCFEGVGDGSSKMCHRPQNFGCKTTADVANGKDMNAATGPSLAVYGNSPVPHSKRARPRLQISAG